MGLTGGLDELALADLVEMTALGSKTGRLTLTDEEGGVAGSLSFRDGRLVAAACGPLADERGFYALLELKAGSFDFDPQAQLDEETCNLSTESLLMEGMRRIDEIRRLRHIMPAPAIARLLAGIAADPNEARVLGYLGPGSSHRRRHRRGRARGRRDRRVRRAQGAGPPQTARGRARRGPAGRRSPGTAST